MGPKKKDKSKSAEWLQCSLCGKLILPADAELHSKSCDSNEYPFILKNCLTGKVVKAEDITDGDKGSVAKNVRDKDSSVWLSVAAMTMCDIAIGQLVVVGEKTIKRAWPLTNNQPLTSIGLSKQSMEELGLKDGKLITAQKLLRRDDVALSLTIKLRNVNQLFEKEEFQSYVSSYLDETFLAMGTPLRIKYFGQVCHCYVSDIKLSMRVNWDCDTKPNSFCLSDSFSADQSAFNESSPSVSSTNQSNITEPDDLNWSSNSAFGTPTSNKVSNADLSESFSNLNLTNDKLDTPTSRQASTPRTRAKRDFPSLGTPVSIVNQTTNLSESQIGAGDGSSTSYPDSQGFGKVVSGFTRITIQPVGVETDSEDKEISEFTLKDVGGMDAKIEELKRRIYRVQQPGCLSGCILVHGPPGTGKTLLVRAVCNSLDMHTVYVAGTDIWSKLFGQAEANLRNIFKSATERSPSVIVIDDMDVVCPKRTQQTAGQQEHRIVGTLLSLVDGATSKDSSVVVIGITNKPDNLDPAVRRSGRFGCEVEVTVPNPTQRAEILSVLLNDVPHSINKDQIDTVARNLHGYVGADLTALINEASVHALSNKNLDDGDVDFILTVDDLVYASQLVKPSALREIQLEVPQVKWSDIGGMSEVKMRLKEAVELPLTHPALYKNLGIEPPRGLLMYGPPGCSKTMIARAVATECQLNFLAVKGPELFNQYVGESEKALREVFRKARSAAPSVIFFDEIDAISAKRGSGSSGSGVDDRVLTQLLTEMDGLEHLKDVFIMAATNRPDKIDRALMRPGRFDSLVYVPLPDDATRKEILETKLKKMKTSEDVELDALVEATLDYSGAEVIQLCQEAALTALREDIQANEVHCRHFEQAATKVLPQTDAELLKIYHKFSMSR